MSDALADTIFGKSESVVALKLSSVMCAPLLAQGERVGALYVGNDEVKHLFERPQLELLTIFAAQASLILQNAMLLSALRADKEKLAAELADKRFGEIIGVCPSMMEVFRKLQKVATTDICVLITGETGTGKELIAREIHRRSNRADGPFVTINCGAIPENLIESELFGHVQGRLHRRRREPPGQVPGGRRRHALPRRDRRAAARTCRSSSCARCRSGSSSASATASPRRSTSASSRRPTATSRRRSRQGGFREDLYYRLNVVNLWLPPLRERGDDVLIIAKCSADASTPTSSTARCRASRPSALSAIRKYAWPGNIRQLENRIKKALVLCDKTLLGPEDLDLGPEAMSADPAAREGQGGVPAPLHPRGARAQQRQPHQDRARPRRRSAHHLPLPREGAEPDAERHARREPGTGNLVWDGFRHRSDLETCWPASTGSSG